MRQHWQDELRRLGSWLPDLVRSSTLSLAQFFQLSLLLSSSPLSSLALFPYNYPCTSPYSFPCTCTMHQSLLPHSSPLHFPLQISPFLACLFNWHCTGLVTYLPGTSLLVMHLDFLHVFCHVCDATYHAKLCFFLYCTHSVLIFVVPTDLTFFCSMGLFGEANGGGVVVWRCWSLQLADGAHMFVCGDTAAAKAVQVAPSPHTLSTYTHKCILNRHKCIRAIHKPKLRTRGYMHKSILSMHATYSTCTQYSPRVYAQGYTLHARDTSLYATP